MADSDLEGSPRLQPDDNQALVIGAAPSDRLIVLAGPGSGKTEVSARRIPAMSLRSMR
jgi:superfamily I DNA/RNA helicase